MNALLLLWKRAVQFYTKDIWLPARIGEKSPRGWACALLRVVSITITGILATRAFIRAAALSFTSLLSLGPLIALAMLVAGVVFRDYNPDMIADKLNDLIKFVAPHVEHYEDIRQQDLEAGRQQGRRGKGAGAQDTRDTPQGTQDTRDTQPRAGAADSAALGTGNPPAAPAPATAQSEPGARKARPEIVKLINNFITNARSGTVGGISVLSVIMIVMFLFGAIEDEFNDIWGVRRTRTWFTRVVFYWAVFTLGIIVFAVSIATLTASTFENFFRENIPLGSQMIAVANFMTPAMFAALAVVALTLLYRFVPNTRVFWRAAFAGALTTAVLLVGNNMVAFTYFRRIEITQSLYGSLGVLPVLMLGLYVFWLIVLVGGQVSYAVQNVHFRNSQIAWGALSHARRERLTLIVFLTIARRFQACLPPCSISQLGDTINAPAQILNECLNRLIDLKLVTPVPPAAKGKASTQFLFQPARPLNRTTLGAFKTLFENLGEDPAGTLVDSLDPVGIQYHDAIVGMGRHPPFTETLEDLFTKNPVNGTHPPYALGDKVEKQN